MILWIALSAIVILINKYILSFSGFPYPVALTCVHMLFCSALAIGLVRAGVVEATPITADTYIRCAEPPSSRAVRGVHARVSCAHPGWTRLGASTTTLCLPPVTFHRALAEAVWV